MFTPSFEDVGEEASHYWGTFHQRTFERVIGDEPSKQDIISEIEENPEIRDKLVAEQARRNISLLRAPVTGRTNYREILEEEIDDPSKEVHEEYNLEQSQYFLSHFKFAGKKAEVYEIQPSLDEGQELPDILREERAPLVEELSTIQNDDDYYYATSRIGNRTDQMDDTPRPRVIYADGENRLLIDFWMVGKTSHYFDINDMDYKPVQHLGEIVCRIHLDKQFLELQSKRATKDQIKRAKEEIKRLFDNKVILERKEMNQEDLEARVEEFDQVTHEKRVGAETSVAMTRTQEEHDIRDTEEIRDQVLTFSQDKVYGKLPIPELGNEAHQVKIYTDKNHFSSASSKLLPGTRAKIIRGLYDFCWTDD